MRKWLKIKKKKKAQIHQNEKNLLVYVNERVERADLMQEPFADSAHNEDGKSPEMTSDDSELVVNVVKSPVVVVVNVSKSVSVGVQDIPGRQVQNPLPNIEGSAATSESELAIEHTFGDFCTSNPRTCIYFCLVKFEALLV